MTFRQIHKKSSKIYLNAGELQLKINISKTNFRDRMIFKQSDKKKRKWFILGDRVPIWWSVKI